MNNRFAVLDYTEHGTSIYIAIEVYDAAQSRLYAEEVRVLGDLLYGDLIHASRSPLTESCRREAIAYLTNYFSL